MGLYFAIDTAYIMVVVNQIKRNVVNIKMRIKQSHTPYQRIVSLMPSNTEILYELGLKKQLIGVSTVDDYPKDIKKEENNLMR